MSRQLQAKNGKRAPSNLTDSELFILVAYVLDMRKKDSSLPWEVNFSSRLSRVTRDDPERLDGEMAICVGHFMKALEKRKTPEQQSLY